MSQLANVSRLVLLWLVAFEHHAASSPPVDGNTQTTVGDKTYGQEGFKTEDNDGRRDKQERDPNVRDEVIVHDPWFIAPLSRIMGGYVKASNI